MKLRLLKALSRCFLRLSFFAFLISMVLFVFQVYGENLELTVGLYENPPKLFTADSGKPSGIFIDILEHIASQESWRLRYRRGTWAQCLDLLGRGEIDLMPDVAYTAERAAVFDFNKEPVLSSWFQVFARADSGIRSILDLEGKKVTVLDGSVQQAAFENLVGGFQLQVQLVPLPDYQLVFEKVAAGAADAAIVNRFYGAMNADRYGLQDTAVIFHPTALFFATPKGKHEAVLKTLDEHIRRLKREQQSAYYESLKRWTAQRVVFEIPRWIKITGLVVGGLLVLSLGGGALLKSQVNARTRELKEMNREMEARIQQRTAELAQAMEKAQEADRLKSAFLATMSHELRTPLNSIIGFTGILLQGLAGPLNDEQRKQLGIVQNSARHLLALINDVLDISKIEAGELKLSAREFDLPESLRKVFEMVLPLAQKKGLEMILVIEKDVSRVVGDQRRLEQIILDLLNNAVKFTEKGFIKVTCSADGDQYVLSVSDTGIGIKPEDLLTIFHPFRQIDTGLARKHEGTGLGLSISKKLVTMMGGTIHVASRWAEGSTFTVRFPKIQEPKHE